jgi:hypothetical protein
MDADVRILKAFNEYTALVTMREERKGIARDLLENRVVVPAG